MYMYVYIYIYVHTCIIQNFSTGIGAGAFYMNTGLSTWGFLHGAFYMNTYSTCLSTNFPNHTEFVQC